MSHIPADAWHTIAQYVPAKPIVFLQMATVSSDLYLVFTSDHVWERVNVCGVKKDICRHYLAEVYASSPEELDFKLRLHNNKIGKEDGEFANIEWFNQRDYESYVLHTGPVMSFARGWYFARISEMGRRVIQETGRLELLSKELRQNKDLLMLAVSRRGWLLKDIPNELRDRDLVLAAVQNDGLALQYADDSFKADAKIVLAAVFQNGLAIQYAPHFQNLRVAGTTKIAKTAIRNNLASLYLLPIQVRKSKEIAALACSIGQKASGIRNTMCSFRVLNGAKRSRLV